MATKSGVGTTVTGTFGAAAVEIESVELSGATREVIETSHLGIAASGAPSAKWKTYIPSDMVAPGQATLTCNMDVTTNVWMTDLVAQPGTFIITYTGGSGNIHTYADSFVVSVDPISIPLEDKITCSITVQLGALTVS